MHIIGFSKYSQRFPKWLNQFASLLAVNESSVVLPLQQHFILPVVVVFFLIRQGGHKYEAISHCDFNLHFPMTNKAEHTSMFVYHLYTFRSVQSLSSIQLFTASWTAACQPPCPSPTPRVYSNSCPLSRWCHPTTASSVIPFSSHLQSFPASGSFQMSQFFTSGGQSVGVSASASVLPMNIQDWFPLGLTDLISL